MGCDEHPADQEPPFKRGGLIPAGAAATICGIDGCCDYIIPYRTLRQWFDGDDAA